MSQRPKYATPEERRIAQNDMKMAWRRAKAAAAPDPETHPLRIWRRSVGLNQREAGIILGVSAGEVCYYEKGVIRTPEWLLDWLAGEARTMTREEAWRRAGKEK